MSEKASRLFAALAERYAIERELGAGGMATVYLAEDLKHERKVALKVLKPELAAVLGADRFVQEIKTTASLQHPHILPLFDSGQADGFLYYVMPYIEGETLRDKLDRETQLGIEEAVRITTEVADALDYAHRQGVIHRDIKPENILLHDGRPMVADFGIALAVSAAAGGRMTETGLSLGTPHYMSPEQATAEKDLTNRSDIYSLACVLYEMLTGSPPHVGSSAQQIIMKIVTDEARPLTELRKSVPSNVAAAVAKALEKLPADRFASSADFAAALANPGFTSSVGLATAAVTTGRSARPPARLSALTIALVAFALVASALAAWGWLRRPPPRLVSRYSVNLEGTDISNSQDAPVISPDGRRIVYHLGATGRLVVRDADDLTGTPIPDFENVWTPFFSPDGVFLAFMTGFPGDLVVLEPAGGSSTTVVRDSALGWGGSWSDDGWLYFTSRGATTLMRVRPSGGEPTPVAQTDTTRDELFIRWPCALPGGDRLVVTVWRKRGAPDIALVDAASGVITVLRRGVRAFYAPTGHLIVAQGDGTVWAVPFDPERGQVSGSPVQVLDGLRVLYGGIVQLALSSSGTLMYSRYHPSPQVVRVTRTGATSVVDPDWHGEFGGLALSPDGKRLTVDQVVGGRGEIWVKALDSGPTTRVALGGALTFRPFWSPDGRWIGFLSDMNGTGAAYRVLADGSGSIERLTHVSRAIDEGEWSRDGQWLVLRLGSGGARDIYALQVGVDSIPKPVVATEFDEYSPTLSPDGRWLAYGSNGSGRDEVYVRPFPDVQTERTQVSVAGGSEPTWSHSGRELFYRDAEGILVAAAVEAGSNFRITERQPLFSASAYRSDNRNRAYAVSLDDRSFLFVDPQSDPSSEVVLVLNWFEELKALMDGGR